MKVELEMAKRYEKLFKGVNVKAIVEESLKEVLTSEFSKRFSLNLLREVSYREKPRASKLLLNEFPKGKLNKKELRKISEEIKEGMARRHGL